MVSTVSKEKMMSALMIFIMFCISIFHLPVVNGDVAPDPNYMTTISAMGETLDSYLDKVCVYMYIGERSAEGIGFFKIKNPSNEWENFSVIFDPGANSYDNILKIGQEKIDFEYVEYENFYGEDWDVYGVRFNLSIPSKSSIEHTAIWRYDINHDSWKSLYQRTYRYVEYLVIGMMGWSRPITSVDVSFVMETDAYDTEVSKSSELTMSSDIYGRKVYNYHSDNFSEDRLLLRVAFKDEQRLSPSPNTYIQCGVILFFIIVVTLIGVYFYRDQKRKNEQ